MCPIEESTVSLHQSARTEAQDGFLDNQVKLESQLDNLSISDGLSSPTMVRDPSNILPSNASVTSSLPHFVALDQVPQQLIPRSTSAGSATGRSIVKGSNQITGLGFPSVDDQGMCQLPVQSSLNQQQQRYQQQQQQQQDQQQYHQKQFQQHQSLQSQQVTQSQIQRAPDVEDPFIPVKNLTSLNIADMDSFKAEGSDSPNKPTSSVQRPRSLSRPPSSTYTPPRHPSVSSNGMPRVPESRSASANGTGSVISRRKDTNAQYQAQERVYIQKMRNQFRNDYYTKGVTSATFDVDNDSDDESNTSELDVDASGLEALGPSFDISSDSVTYPFLQPGVVAAEGSEQPEKLRERLEWQVMLSSVLTGEVVKSEKQRIFKKQGFSMDKIDEEELWLALRARVCGRTVDEQRRVIEYARSSQGIILEDILRFQVPFGVLNEKEAMEAINSTIDRYFQYSQLWSSSLSMIRDRKSIFRMDAFKERIDALITWHNITQAIYQETVLLQEWTGSNDLNLTRVPDQKDENGVGDDSPFIERILKQKDLTELFEKRILGTIGPLIGKARAGLLDHYNMFMEMGVPLFLDDLLHLMLFPTRLIQEVIRMRLSYARKLIEPTMMMIDQMIDDFSLYIRLAQATKERYLDFSTPVPEKGWVLPDFLDENFDATIIDCTKFYMELLQRKFLSNPKGNYSFRTFKEVEMLESEYLFLEEIGYWIDGGDIMIAEQFASLTTKLVARLLAYWENVSKLPEKLNSAELTKWYSTASDNVRTFQRKMVRFFNLLSASYANATDYQIQGSKMKHLVESLIKTGHFLVYTGNLEKDGMYVIADPSLKNQPQILKQIITGYSRRIPAEEEEYVSYVLIFCPQDPFVWGGEIYNLEMPDVAVDMKVGRMRLVSEGRFNELAIANRQFATLCGSDLFDVLVDFKSNLFNVDNELLRMKKLFFRQAFSVVNSIALIRAKCKGRGCNDVVHQLFAFAREFGQRSLQIVDPSRRSVLGMKLINLCIEWVSFICDDCDLTEYKTFRWTVTALEFSMVMTRGVNVLALTDEQFSRLQVKVAGCMSLLISHFDIMGARSKAAAKEQQMAELARKKKVAYPNFKGDDDLMSIFREEAVKKLVILEEQRRQLESEQHMVGKVLDDSNMDTHFLSVLASSFSNVSIRWQQGRFIGGGTFGSVYAAVNLDTGGVMAVKEIRLQDTQSIRHIVKSIKDEMTVLEMLNHPNIVQYFGVEVHRDRVFIFMEYCQGGSLANLLEHGRIEDEQVMQVYTLQMLEGLAYLHQSGIVHRDIKPENILLDHLGIIKFVDFGAAKVIAKTGRTKAADGTAASTRTKLNSMTGTPMYMSPEVITGSNPGRQGCIDVWSLGCCVLEMATGRRPWANLDNEWAIMYHIAAGHMPQMPNNDQISPAGRNFLMRCLQRDPSIRPSAVELLNDPWIIQTRLMALGSMDNLNSTSEGSDSSMN